MTACPNCRTPSQRIQRRYRRRPADLPLSGRRIEPQVVVRCFWCDAATYGRKIFAQRSSDDVLPVFARRTSRLEEIVHHPGLTTGRDRLTKAKTLTVAAVEGRVPALVEAREVVGAFQTIVRGNEPGRLDGWLRQAEASLLASFARGIGRDQSAVQAAITLPCSNGETEGQITKLRLVKRQMYGRDKIDLLQARLIGCTP